MITSPVPVQHVFDRPTVLPPGVLLAGVLLLGACAGPGASRPAGADAAADTPAPPTRAVENLPHRPTIALPSPAPVATMDADGEPVDAIDRLQALLDEGRLTLEYDSVTGYLPALLAALDIPVSSQTLIFSRTSLQTTKISPWAPRAVYFNDDVYIGYVSDDSPILEVAAVDPDDGSAFYILPQDPTAPPRFLPETRDCLGCHEAPPTMGVPGVLVRSTVVDRHGWTIGTLHDDQVTDRTPWPERFAGWYVTGTHGGSSPGGNVQAELLHSDVDNPRSFVDQFDIGGGGNVTDLSDRFDFSVYLSGHSDLVALLVLTHQTRIHNVITHLHHEVETQLRLQTEARVTRGIEIPESGLLPTAEIAIDAAVDQLVREMLFSNAAPIPGPIAGTTDFAEHFAARGPFDEEGRSLRTFDLETRLFRYPLSFLVYTPAFAALPELARSRVWTRLDEVLTGAEGGEAFAHLDTELRGDIREILLATSPDFSAHVAQADADEPDNPRD